MRMIKHDPGPSPFVPGAEVGVGDGCRPYRLGRVSKVRKNGNFTIFFESGEQSSGQYRRSGGDVAWPCGESRYASVVARLWNAEARRDNVELIFAHYHAVRCHALRALFAEPSKLDRGFVVRFAKFIAAEAVVALGTKQ